MPDKNQDWATDQAFWDSAWEDMQQQLDKHLPVQQPKRRRAIWWWSLVGILLLLVSGLAWKGLASSYPTHPPTQEKEAQTKRDKAVASTEIRLENTGEARMEPASTDKESQAAAIAEAPLKNTREAGTEPGSNDGNKQQVATTQKLSERPFPRLEKMPPTKVTPRSTSSFPTQTTLPAQTPENTEPASLKTNLLLPRQSAINQLPTLPSQLLPVATKKLNKDWPSLKKTATWAWGAEMAGNFDWASLYPGIGLAAIGSKTMGRRNQLILSLGYLRSRESFGQEASGLDQLASPVENMPDSLTLAQIQDLFTQEAVSQGSNYIVAHRLRLGLGWERSLSARLQLGAQAGASYLFAGRAPLFIPLVVAEGSGLIANNTGQSNEQAFRFASINALANSDQFDRSGFAAAGTSLAFLQRWDFDLQVRLQYRLNGQLSVFALAQHSFQPAYDTPTFRRGRGQLGLRYMLR